MLPTRPPGAGDIPLRPVKGGGEVYGLPCGWGLEYADESIELGYGGCGIEP